MRNFIASEKGITIATNGTDVGIAICRKNETFDREFGRKLAKARMLEDRNEETKLLLDNYSLRDTNGAKIELGGIYNIKTLDGEKIKNFEVNEFDGKILSDNDYDFEINISDIKKLKRKG